MNSERHLCGGLRKGMSKSEKEGKVMEEVVLKCFDFDGWVV